MKILLKDFALTGKFGPVNVGMHRDGIVEILGKPDAEQDFGTGFSGLLYAWYEFFYYTDSKILSSIQNDHLMANCLNHGECIYFENDKFRIDHWFLDAGKDFTYQEVKDILVKEKINFKEVSKRDYLELKFESGVKMDFVESSKDSEKDKHLLNGIRFFPDFD